MPEGAAGEHLIPFKCPNPACGHHFYEALEWFKTKPCFDCPFCGLQYAIDPDEVPPGSFLRALLESDKPPES